MIRILELFGGIGACSKALERQGIDYEIMDYVEIDKYAVASFNAMHGANFEPQDIRQWDKDIAVDLIMHGSPCQDFSIAGRQAGGDEGSGTRSSLMYETLRIVEKLKPKYVIWENVKNLLSNKHRHNFDAYLEYMESLGYKNFYQVLNAKDYGVPQNRERVFTVSILGDGEFKFPEKQPLTRKLKDILEEDVDEKYFVKKTENLVFGEKRVQWDNSGKGYGSQQDRAYYEDGIAPALSSSNPSGDKSQVIFKIKTANQKGYDEAVEGDGVDLAYPESNTRRDRVGHGVSKTIMTADSMGVVENFRIRKLTPRECWRLMGFDEFDFEKAEKVNSNAQLYKQAGNSIVVNVLEAIFKNLLLGVQEKTKPIVEKGVIPMVDNTTEVVNQNVEVAAAIEAFRQAKKGAEEAGCKLVGEFEYRGQNITIRLQAS